MRWMACALVFASCASPSRTDEQPRNADPLDGITSLEVTPSAGAVITRSGQPGTTSFRAVGHFRDGRTTDVTTLASWALLDDSLGTIVGGEFTSNDNHGGKTQVIATTNEQSASATLTVKYEASRVSTEDGSTAPADANTKFVGTIEPTLSPTAIYPLDGAIVPRNLGEIEVHWRRPGNTNLYEVVVSTTTFELHVYTNAALPNGSRAILSAAEWNSLAASSPGEEVTVLVRAVDAANPAQMGESVPIHFQLGKDPVEGGIYYWASVGGMGNTGGIFRHTFGDTAATAQPFYTPNDAKYSNKNHCVACHAISRDGTRMALTFDGGDGPGGILQVAGKTPVVNGDKGIYWNFASYSPDGKRLVTAGKGALKILDSDTGALLATLPTTAPATHPDWSADGKKIAYTQFPTFSSGQVNWAFKNGSILIAEDGGSGFGPGTVLVAAQNGENNYYPSLSPDGNWVLFNRSRNDAYDDPDAEIWVISSDGKVGPIRLARANGNGTLTNSWPRFSPFVQNNGPNGPLLYLTFSSKRDFGITLVGLNRPQIWMVGFDPSLASAGQDPSSLPFWLPFQDLASNNHIAQWTNVVIP